MDIHVNAAGFSDAPEALLSGAVAIALDSEDATEGELSLTLLDDEAIRALNREYLGRDYVTDVIAFALQDHGEPLLGDIYIGLEQAQRQARQLGTDTSKELARLAIHGTLHVLGHDHPEGEDRVESPMWALQETLLTRLLDADT